jgi:Spy/CpxP family protein refolding chaperone
MRKLILLTVALATTMLAQPPGPRRGFGPGAPQADRPAAQLTALKDYLGLTDAQVASLRDARTKQAEANKPLRDQLQTKVAALRTEMQKANPDASVVGNLQVEIKRLREQLRTSRHAVNADALAILSPDQQAKLKALEEARKLFPAAAQAGAMGLIAVPEPPAGAGAGMRPMRRMGGGMRPMGMGPGPRGPGI